MTDERMPPQDPRVEAYLESLADLRVPADLAASVASHVREHPSRRPSFRLSMLAGAAGLLLVVAVAMAMGWQPPFDVIPGPPDDSPQTPAVPEPAVLEPEGPFEFARITAVGAEVRTEAGAGSVLRQTTEEDVGRLVLVREHGTAGGVTWVKVEEQASPTDEARFIWLPEEVPSTAPTGYMIPTLESTGWVPCYGEDPSAPTIIDLASMTQAERLKCVGPASFTLGPLRVLPISDETAGTGDPDWLAGPATRYLLPADHGDFLPGYLLARIDPSKLIVLPSDTWILVEAHFDDPAAASCTRTATTTDVPVGDARDQVLWCRQQLVITGYSETDAPPPQR